MTFVKKFKNSRSKRRTSGFGDERFYLKTILLWNITKRWNVNVEGANSTLIFFCLLTNIIDYAHKGN
jgi:hypothetical protein